MSDQGDEHEPYGFTESPVIARLQDEIARLRAELEVMNEEHRLACDDRDLMMRERDEANKALAVYREFIGDEMMEAAKRRAGRG